MGEKKILLLASPGATTNILYNALKDEFFIPEVVLEYPISRVEFLRKRIVKLGLRTVLGQLAFATIVVPLLRACSRQRRQALLHEHGLSDSQIDPARVIRVPSVNSDEAIGVLRRVNPDIVVINGTRIISERTLSAIPTRFVNIHVGITPLYRGVHGCYWALVERDESNCGVTVHLVDRGIDTGGILAQALVRPTPQDNFATYPLLQLIAAIPLLKKVLHDLLQGRIEILPPPAGPSRLWSHPTLFEYLKYRATLRVR